MLSHRLDRLTRALAPYAGILTVSTCGGSTGECPPSDRASVHARAVTTGNVELESSVDGRIAVPITAGAPIIDGEWRCQAGASGSGERAWSDESIVVLRSTVTLQCVNSRATGASRFLSVQIPLADLRQAPEGELSVIATTDLTTPGIGGSQCAASANAKVTITIEREVGALAPAPAHVTADFVRELTIDLRLDGSIPPSATPSSCTNDLRGSITLRARLDAKSFSEADARVCL